MKSAIDDPILLWNLIRGYLEFLQKIDPPWDDATIRIWRVKDDSGSVLALKDYSDDIFSATEEIQMDRYGWIWWGRNGKHLGYYGCFGYGESSKTFCYGGFKTFAFDAMEHPYLINQPVFDDYGNLR